MLEIFNKEIVREEHSRIIKEVQRIRDILSKDVIDYYYDYPESEREENEKRDGIRKYLRIAREDIDRLLDGKLY